MVNRTFLESKTLFAVVCFMILMQAPTVLAHEKGRDVIKFGVFPYKSPKTIVKLFGPITKKIEQALGVKVQLVTAPDFSTYIDRARQGDYDLAFPCVACFFQIQDVGYSVIAKGNPSFYGGTIVRNDSGIDSLDQLKGKKIAAIGKHSYAGHLFLLEQLLVSGIDPKQDVQFQFLGKVDTVIFGVANKKYDAGTLRIDAIESPSFKEVRLNLPRFNGHF